jgi:NAD(P) transhydrogenase subunit beta
MGNSLAAAAFTVWLKLEKYAYPKSLLTFLAKYQTVITLCTAGVVFLFGLLYIAFLWGLLLFFVGICALWLGFSVFVTISSKDISVVNTFFVCYSGLTIAFIGFMLNNYMVLITGAIITGSSLVLIERVSEAQNVRLMHFFKSKTP